MKKLSILSLTFAIYAGCIACGFNSNLCHAAWDATKPADNEKLKDAPGELRANFAAIATGTDSALLITNAKVSASAAIVDTKLATISTAGKVSGAAITLLTSTPSGAGALPIANGGTGQITATAARNALLPTQTSNSGKSLITDATNASWGYPASLTISSQAQGDVVYYDSTPKIARLAAGTSGKFLQTAGAAANPAWAKVDLSASSNVTGNLPVGNLNSGTSASSSTFWRGDGTWASPGNHGIQIFTSSGTYTAGTGVNQVYVSMVGGGGGTGTTAGSSGFWIQNYPFSVTAGNNYTVTIGAAGSIAGDGGNTSFDSLTVLGGKGGGTDTSTLSGNRYLGFYQDKPSNTLGANSPFGEGGDGSVACSGYGSGSTGISSIQQGGCPGVVIVQW